MIEAPDYLTGTPDAARDAGLSPRAFDLLADLLSRVRLAGAIFLRGEYAAPWGLESPGARGLIQLLAPDARRLILFHIVREGHIWVTAGNRRVEAAAGDLVVLPDAESHSMGSPNCRAAVPFGNLLPPAPWQGVQTCRVAGAGERTSMVCGYLKCDELLFNSVLRRLPPLFTVRPRPGPAADWVQACVRYALDEGMQRRAGSDAMMARLPELLFVESLRLYAEQLGPAETGWLAALRDPVLSCALTRLHAAPARKWTVALLAEAIASSRSVLDERFRTLLGQAPMHYLAEWRMQLAADLLRGTRQKLAAIAEQVGYQSEEAFSRAFRRHLGRSPGEWRDRAPA